MVAVITDLKHLKLYAKRLLSGVRASHRPVTMHYDRSSSDCVVAEVLMLRT